MREIRTAIDIAAPVEAVWRVASDFAAYGHWNPFMPGFDGEPRPGTRGRIRVVPPGRRENSMRVRVVEADAPRRLSWRGQLLGPWLFAATHVLELTPRDGGTHL